MVTMDNYEEYMLLYADGELDEAAEKELLAFVALHPQLHSELAIYEACKLQPDTAIVFENKKALMQPVHKGGIIMLTGWIRYGAAAGILLIVLLGMNRWLRHQNENANKEQPAVAQNNVRRSQQAATAPDTHTHQPPAQTVQAIQPASGSATYKQSPRWKDEPSPLPKEQIGALAISPVKPITGKGLHESLPEQQDIDPDELLIPVPVQQEQRKRNLFAWLPMSKEKEAGLEGLKNNMVEKINTTKNLADDLAGTDIVVRVGGKELLVFNF